MGPARYLLSPSAWGVAVEVGVDKPVQACLYSDLGPSLNTHFIEVALEPDPVAQTWRVRYEGGVLGLVDAPQRTLFPQLNRIHESALTPHTMAGVELDDNGRFRATVYLPPAALAVPRNNPPTPDKVLPAGDMFVVDTSTGEFTAPQLAAASPGQWFVALTVLDGTVVATLDGRVLGSLSPADSAELHHAVEDPEGATARAYILDGMVGLDLAVEGERDRVPGLRTTDTASDANAAENAIPGVTVFPDGSWAVTVERDDAVGPEGLVEPSEHARQVEGVEGAEDEPAEPSVDFTPTKTWHISAGNYLTEVEKVRLRRRRRRADGGGLHRLGD